MQSAAQRLRQNDPARTRFYIRLCDETTDANLAEALEQNPFVTDIRLDVEREQRADWNSLMRVIATHANLEKVKLWDAVRAERRNAPAALVRSILQAMEQNTSIQTVELINLHLPTYISTFLDNASAIKSFCLYNCDMEPTEREQGARSLATAFQRNTNIESLDFCRLASIYTIPILEGLRSNVSLKHFMFLPCGSFSDAALSHGELQGLLESTTSIQKFELGHATFSERQFSSIAQAITGSECVSELKFLRCTFRDQSSTAQFRSILQNKQNLTSLCLAYCNFGREQVHGDIISILLRPDSLLQCFEFQCDHPLEGAFRGVQYKNLLQAIEKSKLERFKIGIVQSQPHLLALTEFIPLMKLKELEVVLGDGFADVEAVRQDLHSAIKNNFSLRSVKGGLRINYSSSDLFEKC